MVENNQALWNFDGAQLEVLFNYKINFIENLDNWELEKAYWALRGLRREFDAALSRGTSKLRRELQEGEEKKKKQTEKQHIDDLMSTLDEIRNKYPQNPSKDKKTEFFSAMEGLYMIICRYMKAHGIYFREGGDSRLAVMRR